MVCHGDFACFSTSKPRHDKTFSGLPLDDDLAARNVEARGGLQVVDLRSGDAVYWIRLEGIVEEIHDVMTLPGVRHPALIGFVSDGIRRLISMETETLGLPLWRRSLPMTTQTPAHDNANPDLLAILPEARRPGGPEAGGGGLQHRCPRPGLPGPPPAGALVGHRD